VLQPSVSPYQEGFNPGFSSLFTYSKLQGGFSRASVMSFRSIAMSGHSCSRRSLVAQTPTLLFIFFRSSLQDQLLRLMGMCFGSPLFLEGREAGLGAVLPVSLAVSRVPPSAVRGISKSSMYQILLATFSQVPVVQKSLKRRGNSKKP